MKKQMLPKIIFSQECKGKTVLQHFVLSAKTLFKNGRGDLAGMLPESRSEIDDLVVDLKKLDQRHISHIVISGNSAQEESRDMSKKLSAERAKTILYLLQQQGVQLPMEVTGYGDQQLVSRNCALRNPIDTKMREACEQSNRRGGNHGICYSVDDKCGLLPI